MFAAPLARLAILLAMCLPFTGTAKGHAVVVETAPRDGAVLASAPEHIEVTFNEPVSLIAASLLDAGGRNVLAQDNAAVNGSVLKIAVPPSLAAGSYVASYRVVSIDGHPISGSIVFAIGEASGIRGPMAPSSDRAWRVVWTAVRATFDAGVLGSIGGVLFLLSVAGTGSAAVGTARITERLAIVGLVAAALSIAAQGGLLAGASLGDAFGPAIWRAGLFSPFGISALAACAGLGLMIVGLRWPSAAGRALALAGASIALLSYLFAGHVVTAGPYWLTAPALFLHIAAVAFWIGSLLPLRSALPEDDAAAIMQRFSVIAVLTVGALVVVGVVIAALQVRSPGALVTTTYGRVLLAKVALVAGLLLLAAMNKWRLTPALARREPGAVAALRRAISAELAVVGIVLVATAALGTIPPPRALQSDHAHDPQHHAAHEHHAADEHHAPGLSLLMSNGSRGATVTLASAHAGPNDVRVSIAENGGALMMPREVIFSAAHPEAGIEPIRRAAVFEGAGVWKVDGLLLVPAGQWSVRVEALISDFEKPIFEGTVELR